MPRSCAPRKILHPSGHRTFTLESCAGWLHIRKPAEYVRFYSQAFNFRIKQMLFYRSFVKIAKCIIRQYN